MTKHKNVVYNNIFKIKNVQNINLRLEFTRFHEVRLVYSMPKPNNFDTTHYRRRKT